MYATVHRLRPTDSGALMTNEKICSEKSKLVSAYERATRAYSDAVANLQRIMGTSPKADYDAQYRMTEALRLDAMKVQETLQKHVAMHGC
jgi:hypothetical protein